MSFVMIDPEINDPFLVIQLALSHHDDEDGTTMKRSIVRVPPDPMLDLVSPILIVAKLMASLENRYSVHFGILEVASAPFLSIFTVTSAK